MIRLRHLHRRISLTWHGGFGHGRAPHLCHPWWHDLLLLLVRDVEREGPYHRWGCNLVPPLELGLVGGGQATNTILLLRLLLLVVVVVALNPCRRFPRWSFTRSLSAFLAFFQSFFAFAASATALLATFLAMSSSTGKLASRAMRSGYKLRHLEPKNRGGSVEEEDSEKGKGLPNRRSPRLATSQDALGPDRLG